MEEDKIIQEQQAQCLLEQIFSATGDDDSCTDTCIICLETITERAVAAPCCHQNFDFICLVSWLQEQPVCPLCKVEVRSVRYDQKSLQDSKVYHIVQSPHSHLANRLQNHRSRPRPDTQQQRARPETPSNANGSLLQRQEVYRYQLYSLHVGSNRLSNFRDLTPSLVARDEQLVSRARKWIRRELQVFGFLNPNVGADAGVAKRANNAEFLLDYIIAILKTLDIKGSGGQAEDMLQEFIGRDNARLFLHELRAWLRSPYMFLDDWDRHVQYNRAPRSECQKKVCNAGPDYETASHRTSKAPSRGWRHRTTDHYMPYNGKRRDRISQRSRPDPG